MGRSSQWSVPPPRLSDTVQSSSEVLCVISISQATYAFPWPLVHLIAPQRAG